MGNEIDLHGLTALDALETFLNFYNSKIKKKNFAPINVIHGYGANGEGGKILIRLRNLLKIHENKLSYKFGENLFPPNPGRTVVTPKKPLPSIINTLAKEILDFCKIPKTKTKIAGKFRRYGEEKIKESLSLLEKNGLIEAINKGKHKAYTLTAQQE
jgi:hypothetical protein